VNEFIIKAVRSGVRTFVTVALTVTACLIWWYDRKLPDGLLEVLVMVYTFYFSVDLTRWLIERMMKERTETV